MATTPHVSRRSFLSTASVALVGSAAAVAPALSKAATVSTADDQALIELWPRYQAAEAHYATLLDRANTLGKAAIDAVPKSGLKREDFLTWSEAEQEVYHDRREELYIKSWDESGANNAVEAQDRFYENVLAPMEKIIRDTAPVTLAGIAIKAAYLLDYGDLDILNTDEPDELDYHEEVLHEFIQQLADLVPAGKSGGRA